jgi:hypothetical protein
MMATVASLFGSQAKATEALDALADSEFADVDTRVFENVGPNPAEPDVGAVPHLASSRLSAVLDPRTGEWFEDLDDNEADFFIQQVRSGGVLLLAKVEARRAGALESFLHEQGGQTAEEYS